MDVEANRKTLNVAVASPSQPTLDANINFPSLNWGEPKQVVMEPLPALNFHHPINTEKVSSPCSGPAQASSPGALGLPIPSPIITKRTRTNST